MQIAARDPPGPADRESAAPPAATPTTNNNLLFQRAPGAGLSPSGNGKPGRTWDHRPWRVLLADTRCRPPTLHHPSLHPPYPVC
ncbi:hypothetical protein EVAR_75036_1 [Eumeta japonica]|uniref:Uncharacterized protein n=1 Tax=Eumeta variegata TaxID=151549 RepID=A0A4C1W266_EUMVA|nr:hypothetical protein EVAR_75036_1 [Eumeta japonica]